MKNSMVFGVYETPEVIVVHLKAEGVICGSGTDYSEGGSFGDDDGPRRVMGSF